MSQQQTMQLGLQDRVALVTGASQGIGAAVGLELARQGCDVALTYVGDPGAADAPVAAIEALGRRALPLVADAADSAATDAAVARTVAELGGLDVLVCNAGITRDGVVWNMSDKAWDEVMAVNLKGYFTFNHALTKTLARELGKFNVTVNAVAPGMVATEMAANLPPEFRNNAVRESVLGRLAEPADIAHVVAFLCSDFARHVTGQVIRVDGGQYI